MISHIKQIAKNKRDLATFKEDRFNRYAGLDLDSHKLDTILFIN